MRKTHLLLLLVIIVSGLFFARRQSTGQAKSSHPPGPAGPASDPTALPSTRASFALHGSKLLTRPVTEALREEQRQQIIRYFQSQIAATPAKRDAFWRPNFSSVDAYKASVEPHRPHLRRML